MIKLLNKTFIDFLAACSHPDKKFKWIKSLTKKREAIEMMKDEMRKIQQKKNNTFQSTSSSQQTQAKKKTFSMDYEDEDEQVALEFDEIDRWEKFPKDKNFENYPITKEIHIKYNTSLGSEAMVERAFSLGKLVLGLRRGALKDSNFEKQLVCKANQKLNPKLFSKK